MSSRCLADTEDSGRSSDSLAHYGPRLVLFKEGASACGAPRDRAVLCARQKVYMDPPSSRPARQLGRAAFAGG